MGTDEEVAITSPEAAHMIQCDRCALWVHVDCDGMDDANYEAYEAGAPGYEVYDIATDGVPIVAHVHGGHSDVQVDGNLGEIARDYLQAPSPAQCQWRRG